MSLSALLDKKMGYQYFLLSKLMSRGLHDYGTCKGLSIANVWTFPSYCYCQCLQSASEDGSQFLISLENSKGYATAFILVFGDLRYLERTSRIKFRGSFLEVSAGDSPVENIISLSVSVSGGGCNVISELFSEAHFLTC